jgi:hypothetical protein
MNATRNRRAATFGFALVFALSMSARLVSAAGADSANSVTTSGYVLESEVQVSPGWVIDTYTSGDTTVRVFARAGSLMSVPSTASTAGLGSTSFSVASPDLKKDQSPSAGSATGAVAALIALGVDPQTALQKFGGLDTLDGSTPASDATLAAAAAGPTVSLASYRAPSSEPQVVNAVSNTIPYDTQCATINTQNHLVQGYGCSTLYLVWASGGNWYFSSKYALSAQSTSTSLFPLRLRSVAWRLGWAANNLIYDWDPKVTKPEGSCNTVTSSLGASLPYFSAGISISSTICPDNFGPWGPLTQTQSGATWTGSEAGTAFEAAVGTQQMHNPANVSSSHTSTYSITWSCGLDC